MDELKQTTHQSDLPAEVTVPIYGPKMDQQSDAELRTVSRFFLKHPSLVLTFGYLIASVMGLIFTLSLLGEFGFYVLPYLELTDFLLAAIAHPKTILNLIIGTVSVIVVLWIDRQCRKKYLKYALWIDNSYRSTPFIPNWVVGAFTFAFYLYFASTSQVPKIAQAIKTHKADQYQLSLIYPIQPGGKEIRQLNEVQIITRTVSYLWIYHQDQVKLIPHANVAALIPVLSKEPDKSAEQKGDTSATADKTTAKEPAAVPVKS
ncbi:hypothetical protein [Rheinheimera sp.]|uniref:hypothetical protein n=1 Tax=Rheinheimera sp. TaxID=1869214 RepID=UPI00260FE53A|nr:hypothetical protein [Rheinheimera sp.]MCA1930404.1 hypothetical protein [Rheinheimera sp.]